MRLDRSCVEQPIGSEDRHARRGPPSQCRCTAVNLMTPPPAIPSSVDKAIEGSSRGEQCSAVARPDQNSASGPVTSLPPVKTAAKSLRTTPQQSSGSRSDSIGTASVPAPPSPAQPRPCWSSSRGQNLQCSDATVLRGCLVCSRTRRKGVRQPPPMPSESQPSSAGTTARHSAAQHSFHPPARAEAIEQLWKVWPRNMVGCSSDRASPSHSASPESVLRSTKRRPWAQDTLPSRTNSDSESAVSCPTS